MLELQRKPVIHAQEAAIHIQDKSQKAMNKMLSDYDVEPSMEVV